MKTLQDRVAVVTGACGGIGRATCIALADAGAHVALVDLQLEGVDELVDRIHQVGRQTSVHQLDVSDRSAVMALPQAVLDAHGAINVLVNNAGVTATEPFIAQSQENFDWVMDINLGGVVTGTRAFLPHLVRAAEGHIVNISSVFGIIGVPGQVAYCTSKFAVRGFTEALAEELKGTTVGTTVVHPGGINTGIIRNSRTSEEAERERMAGFFAKNTLPPEAVADKIVTAILRNRARVLVAPEAHAFDLLKRLMPTWGNRLSIRALVKTLGMEKTMEAQRRKLLKDFSGGA